MNGDPKQKAEHTESRPQPENKLQSIRDITKAIKDGDEKYADRLGDISDSISNLVSELNVIGESLVKLLIEIRDRLPKPF